MSRGRAKTGNQKAVRKGVRFAVFTRDGFRCRYCGQRPPQVTLQIDHIKPVVEGGTNDPSNLITACQECNIGKHTRQIPTPLKAMLLGPPLMSMKDVIAHTGLGYHTIYRDVQAGTLKATLLKSRLRFEPSEVARWLKSETRAAN